MSTFFWPKVSKKSQKSQNLRFLISTIRKLLSEVEPYRTINNEVDVAKKCCQISQKVVKVAKKCYQMWQKVAKGVLSGSNRFQGLPRASKGHGLSRPPTGSHGLPWAPTGSHGLPWSSNGGFQGGFQGEVLPDVEKSHQRGSM